MKNIDLLNNNPKFIGRLTTSALNALPRANEGEMAFCTDTNEVKIYTDGAWVPMGDTGDLLKLNSPLKIFHSSSVPCFPLNPQSKYSIYPLVAFFHFTSCVGSIQLKRFL